MKKDKDFAYWFLNFVMICSFLVILGVVVDLGVVRGGYYKGLALDNRMSESVIPAARGKILDRKGRVLAESVYQYFNVVDGVRQYEDLGDFEGYRFEGKDLAFELRRKYAYGESASFVTGYVNKVAEADIAKNDCSLDLTADDWLGRGGAEAKFECSLRGEAGRRLVEVDAKGDYLRELGRSNPIEGNDISLSIDAFWQDRVYDIIGDKKVAVIISEIDTGRVLVMVSKPAFDPNIFSYKRNNQVILDLLSDDKDYPLLNRAMAAKYQPGSVFKMVVALAGLEEGVIDGNSLIEDTGVIEVGDYSYSNWLWTKRGTTDGMVDIVKAIQRSNDIFFYRLGEKVGPEAIANWATKFGFGLKTGIDFVGEIEGVVSSPEWKEEVRGERWYLGNTYHMAIGQGDMAVTVAQINRMTGALANGGYLCQLTMDTDGQSCTDLGISKSNLELVVEGMKRACKRGGTAWPLYNFETDLACKTGTAEVGDGSNDTHAWLTAFGPVDDPQIAITVLVERGGEGSDAAAPIVGDILKEWFDEPDTKVPRYGKDGKTVVYE